MGRRVLNRKEMRADFDAAERRTKDKEEEDRDEDEEEEEEEDEEDKEGGEEDEEEGEADEDDEEAVAPPPPKKKKAPAAKPKARSRAAKITRMRVVWGVFNNSNACVATYEYPKKEQAMEHAAKLTADKRSTHFVQPVKEPMEVKKDKEK
jgi:cobalamin biosynthesis protein CobT